MVKRKGILLIKASAVALVAGSMPIGAAYAQNTKVATSAGSDQTIVVTARKKEETLLDAPLAVSVFGQKELEQAAFKDITEITKAAPGVFVEPNSDIMARVNTTPRFRGITVASGSRLQQTATVFLDGIYMSGGLQTLGINELQRVEIIKGPQSALFGRNTFAGAINYVTKDPSNEFRLDLSAVGATRGEYSMSAGIEGPLFEGVTARLSGSYNTKDGHYDNAAVQGQRLGDESQWVVSGTLLIEPSDDFKLKLRGSYQKIDDGPAPAVASFGTQQHNFGGFLLGPNGTVDLNDSVQPAPRDGTRTESVFRGRLTGNIDPTRIGVNSSPADIQAFRGFQNDARSDPTDAIFGFKYNPTNVDKFGLQLDSLRLSAVGNVNVTDNVEFSFLGGYNEENFGFYNDFDSTPDVSFGSFNARETTDFTIEGRLSGDLFDESLIWSVGASYVDLEIRDLGGTTSFLGAPIFFPDIFRSTPFITGAQTTGIFGSLEYQFTDQIALTLEGRYQRDKIIQDEVNANLATPISPGTIESFLPRVTLRYQPTSDTTLYATYSEGNLPGGFNPIIASLDAAQRAELAALAPDADITFGEEKLINYEIGWKQRLDGGRIAFNVAAFYMQRSDEIFRTTEVITDTSPTAGSPQITVGFTSNGASTDIYGLEFDAAVQINDNFSVQGSFAYIDSKISSFPAGSGTGDFGDIYGSAADVRGQQAPRFPPITLSLGATYEDDIDLLGFESWYARSDMYFTGPYYTGNANVAKTEEATDVNIRLGLKGQNMGLEFFVTNLLAENAPTFAQNFSDTSYGTRLGVANGFFDFTREGSRIGLRDKRQFGVRANFTFR